MARMTGQTVLLVVLMALFPYFLGFSLLGVERLLQVDAHTGEVAVNVQAVPLFVTWTELWSVASLIRLGNSFFAAFFSGFGWQAALGECAHTHTHTPRLLMTNAQGCRSQTRMHT